MKMSRSGRRDPRLGSAIFEFCIVAIALMLVLFATVEFGRMVLVYSTLANSARAGLRYAIVHGANRTGGGVDGPSGPGANPPEVVQVIRNFAGVGTLNPAAATISVTYPNGSNTTGSLVRVSITYLYDPMTRLPLGVTLGSRSEGVITF